MDRLAYNRDTGGLAKRKHRVEETAFKEHGDAGVCVPSDQLRITDHDEANGRISVRINGVRGVRKVTPIPWICPHLANTCNDARSSTKATLPLPAGFGVRAYTQ